MNEESKYFIEYETPTGGVGRMCVGVWWLEFHAKKFFRKMKRVKISKLEVCHGTK